MAPEDEIGHESGKSRSKVTPRKIKPEAGLQKQTLVRGDVVKHMRHEMLVCSLDAFLDELSPFSPDPHWVDLAYDHLRAKKLLGTPPKTTPQKQTNKRRKTKKSRQAGYQENAGPAHYDEDTQDGNTVEWKAFRGMTPQTMTVSEMTAFKPLEDIVEALRDCPDPDEKRHANGYKYIDCPNHEMGSQILGGGFRVDAAIANTTIYNEEGNDDKGKKRGRNTKGKKVVEANGVQKEETKPTAAQTAVVMEFKKRATSQEKYKNQRQLVSAANHIMNDDARRNWMYGITIENTEMSLWYFSRSYSMKSESFDFTKDFKTFIRVFLSFLYADDEDLGHDPSIVRTYHNQKGCYVYRLQTAQGLKFYKTLEPLYNPRTCCIAGRKSRVWKVVEVANSNNLTPIPGAPNVVLKDCWVDQGSLSEMEIQEQIFESLENVQESAYAWAPQQLQERIKDGLASPERYFMKVVWDWKAGANKEKPKSTPDPYLLTKPLEKSLANPSKVLPGVQSTPTQTVCSSSYASDSLRPSLENSQDYVRARDYKAKQHYRVIYADVGESLAKATSLSDAVTAFNDIFIALTLMFLARWVHRDVSEGNIILVRDGNGVIAKLSDLEYARGFDRVGGAASTDPKTEDFLLYYLISSHFGAAQGTPYFMPLEIHKGRLLFEGPLETTLDLEDLLGLDMPYLTTPSYNFAHDLESLWWIIVWIILLRVKGALPLRYYIFNAHELPHADRESLFKNGFRHQNHLRDMIQPALQDRKAHGFLAAYSNVLCLYYRSGKRQEATSYDTIYSSVWKVIKAFTHAMSDVDMDLEDPHKRALTLRTSDPISPELGKRTRSDDGRIDRETAGSSKKKQKSDGNGLVDTDEEDEEAPL